VISVLASLANAAVTAKAAFALYENDFIRALADEAGSY
jgi:hypothetical protein